MRLYDGDIVAIASSSGMVLKTNIGTGTGACNRLGNDQGLASYDFNLDKYNVTKHAIDLTAPLKTIPNEPGKYVKNFNILSWLSPTYNMFVLERVGTENVDYDGFKALMKRPKPATRTEIKPGDVVMLRAYCSVIAPGQDPSKPRTPQYLYRTAIYANNDEFRTAMEKNSGDLLTIKPVTKSDLPSGNTAAWGMQNFQFRIVNKVDVTVSANGSVLNKKLRSTFDSDQTTINGGGSGRHEKGTITMWQDHNPAKGIREAKTRHTGFSVFLVGSAAVQTLTFWYKVALYSGNAGRLELLIKDLDINPYVLLITKACQDAVKLTTDTYDDDLNDETSQFASKSVGFIFKKWFQLDLLTRNNKSALEQYLEKNKLTLRDRYAVPCAASRKLTKNYTPAFSFCYLDVCSLARDPNASDDNKYFKTFVRFEDLGPPGMGFLEFHTVSELELKNYTYKYKGSSCGSITICNNTIDSQTNKLDIDHVRLICGKSGPGSDSNHSTDISEKSETKRGLSGLSHIWKKYRVIFLIAIALVVLLCVCAFVFSTTPDQSRRSWTRRKN